MIMTNEQYHDFIVPYEDAKNIVLTHLESLNYSIYKETSNHMIHHVQNRMKGKRSIEDKLKKQNMTDSVSNAKDYLMDIAGIRVICYFEEDVFNLVNLIRKQSDIIVLKEADYISKPKENGYRSYHMVIGIQVFNLNTKDYYPVELQLRTLSMDFWASMEHRICYKKDRKNKQELAAVFLNYAKELQQIEKEIRGLERLLS